MSFRNVITVGVWKRESLCVCGCVYRNNLSFLSSWILTHLNTDASAPKGVHYARAEQEKSHVIPKSSYFSQTSLTSIISSHREHWLAYVAPVLRFQAASVISVQEFLFNPSVELLKVILQVRRRSDWTFWRDLLHRASSQCNTLLPPRKRENRLISLTSGRKSHSTLVACIL